LADLKSSFASGGFESLHQSHQAALESHWRYRLLFRIVNLAYPASDLLEIASNLDRHIGELGVADASKAMLATLPLQWRAEFPSQGEAVIRESPIIVFGKHGSILTPFLVAASLDRSDIKMLSASYIAKLGPHVAQSMFPVLLPKPTFRDAGRAGILPRISGWITTRLEPPVEKGLAKERNLESLMQAARHVHHRGALLIAPDARDSEDNWRHGIGHLVIQLAQMPQQDLDAYLVPYRIWAPITGIFRVLSRNPIIRALGKRQYRNPIRIAFGEPFPLSEIIGKTGLDPARITEHLQAHYRNLGF